MSAQQRKWPKLKIYRKNRNLKEHLWAKWQLSVFKSPKDWPEVSGKTKRDNADGSFLGNAPAERFTCHREVLRSLHWCSLSNTTSQGERGGTAPLHSRPGLCIWFHVLCEQMSTKASWETSHGNRTVNNIHTRARERAYAHLLLYVIYSIW